MAGWGYMMLTNMLPSHGNGTYKLYAYRLRQGGEQRSPGHEDRSSATTPTRSSRSGRSTRRRREGRVSGSAFINYGWALTPLPNMIPKDGSTIDVWVDGENLGHPTYDQYRKDVADNFPGC